MPSSEDRQPGTEGRTRKEAENEGTDGRSKGCGSGGTACSAGEVIPETPPVPQDRLDTLYYNKSWKVTPNKAFANYYRLALYPADSTAAKEFRTYYMSGELQGEGCFVVLDRKDDAKSQFAGTFTTYFKDGQVEQKKTYQAGLLSGEYTSYYNNGNVKEHFFMNQGKKMGVGASFTENGRVWHPYSLQE